MGSLNILFVLIIVGAASAATCTRDTYTSLPSIPAFPTSTLAASLTPIPTSGNPLTQDHWSETANLAAYRPPNVKPTSTQTSCPHLATDLKDWHDPATWGTAVPANGASFSIPANTAVLISSCSIDPTWVFGTITVPGTSKLIIGDAAITLNAKGINVQPGGFFLAGSPTCRLRNKVTITLYGQRSAQSLPSDPWVKGISITNATVDVHGVQYFPTWTRLAMTAKSGASWIFVQDVVNWQVGQTIVITTTELKDARDWHRNEERVIAEVLLTTLGSNVAAIRLSTPLSYNHFGGKEYQAEVSLLSRNIVIQGDPTNSEPTDTKASCVNVKDASTYPCEDQFLTGFGAHVFVQGSLAKGRFSGIELYRVGQTNVLGRYALHYHMVGNVTTQNYTNHFVQDSSVHRSYFRCYAIHGTMGVKLTQNTAYDAIGHCYFLEDGVEENNILSYNQAALVHPLGPIVNPSISANGDSWGSQYLSWYSDSPSMILPSDMGAGCFYITNTFNDIYGNAASGGWAGFTIPSLRLPVKLHASITDMCPANRPFRSPFRGNSAHSSGYWWRTAGAIYVGGELQQTEGSRLNYTLGRSRSRSTCQEKNAGTASLTYCPTPLWLRFEDNKVFLSNRGLQNWGDRSEIIRFELHDVSLAMNVFGRVWIDQLLMECRSLNTRPTFFSGCPTAPNETSTTMRHTCNVRDSTFHTTFGGFQWYDVGQRHILTSSTFRNCHPNWDRCLSGSTKGNCSNIAVFTSLTHSDQFVPEIMQVTRDIKYQNVGDLWRFTTKTTDATGVTVSGRLQSWLDVDGSASQLGARAMIGSAWSNDWWKYNKDCNIYKQAWRCKLAANDGVTSLKFTYDATEQAKVGSTLCMNGGGQLPCPVVATIAHFGMTNESAGLQLAVNAKATGPVVGAYGGWFVRFAKGTPRTLDINSVQLLHTTPLVLALPYPADTKFEIYYQGPSSCSTSNVCRHNCTAVSSLAQVVSSFGDAYFWNNAQKTLYVRVVQTASNFGKKGTDPAIWTVPYVATDSFSRGGLSLLSSASTSVIIKATTCSSSSLYCTPQADVKVPAVNVLPTPPAV